MHIFRLDTLNTRKSRATKSTPFRLVFGQDPNDLSIFGEEESRVINEEDCEQLQFDPTYTESVSDDIIDTPAPAAPTPSLVGLLQANSVRIFGEKESEDCDQLQFDPTYAESVSDDIINTPAPAARTPSLVGLLQANSDIFRESGNMTNIVAEDAWMSQANQEDLVDEDDDIQAYLTGDFKPEKK